LGGAKEAFLVGDDYSNSAHSRDEAFQRVRLKPTALKVWLMYDDRTKKRNVIEVTEFN